MDHELALVGPRIQQQAQIADGLVLVDGFADGAVWNVLPDLDLVHDLRVLAVGEQERLVRLGEKTKGLLANEVPEGRVAQIIRRHILIDYRAS